MSSDDNVLMYRPAESAQGRQSAAGVPGGAVPDPPTQAAGAGLSDTAALTPRQLEVLCLLTSGMTNRHIARTLGITEKTVKNHMQAIFARLEVADRTQAALYAVRHRLTA